ncbi:SxtJ family membrane protein [Primorskyibacter sp. S187A]|uniref:SxtJ family membrane protein n=1 Tax=Primorskyibacter sp. S187A TaxID=3415130 RepID=UPI003C7E2CF6
MSDVASHSEVKIGSERSFGLVFAAVFAIIAFWPVVMSGGSVRLWALIIALGFAAIAFIAPRLLAPLNKVWFKFGLLLGAIMAPLVMGLIFVLTVIPIGYVRRMKNPDPLKQRFDPDAETYWVTRSKDDPPSSMTKQF